MASDAHIGKTRPAHASASPVGFTDVDIASMRLLDLLMFRGVEQYPDAPSSFIPALLDEFAPSTDVNKRMIAFPLFHASKFDSTVLRARDAFIAEWNTRKGAAQAPSEPRVSSFNSMLFADPQLALRELQALHVFDILAERFAQTRNTNAVEVNRTLVALNRTGESAAASAINRQPADRDAIYRANDYITYRFAPDIVSVPHMTSLTASMALGAFTMLPAL
jgi:hypothetical protein